MAWTKENNPHSTQKRGIKLSWDEEKRERVLMIDGHTIPGVKRVYVEALVHSFEIHIVMENIAFVIDADTSSIELEEYTGG